MFREGTMRRRFGGRRGFGFFRSSVFAFCREFGICVDEFMSF